jgi:hypothetical protein
MPGHQPWSEYNHWLRHAESPVHNELTVVKTNMTNGGDNGGYCLLTRDVVQTEFSPNLKSAPKACEPLPRYEVR